MKYTSYKNTHLKYISKIPNHWEIVRNRAILLENKKVSEDGIGMLLRLSQYSGISIKTDSDDKGMFRAESLIGYRMVEPYSIVMNIMLAWNGSTGCSKYSGIISPAYAVFNTINKSVMPEYLHYFFRLPETCGYFKAYSTGIIESRLRLYPQIFMQLYSILPPREEQEQIVRYLDWKCSQINKLIHGYQREINLLEERKHAIVNNAVLHGLKKGVSQKDSGVYWLGSIPANWEIRKLRQILTAFSEKNHPEMPLLSVVREKGVIIRDTESIEENHNFIPDDLSGYKLVKKNQFVINKMKSWQGSYGISPYDGIVSPAYFVFDICFDNLEYFHYAIRSKVYVNFFAQASDGIRVGQWDLDMQKMKEIPFIVPTEEEQRLIVNYIKEQHAKLDILIAKLKKQIELLKEYRTRLISDVVTGQIDVRGIDIPDYTPEEDIADSDEIAEEEASSDAE